MYHIEGSSFSDSFIIWLNDGLYINYVYDQY